jgi:hypothetical protein
MFLKEIGYFPESGNPGFEEHCEGYSISGAALLFVLRKLCIALFYWILD